MKVSVLGTSLFFFSAVLCLGTSTVIAAELSSDPKVPTILSAEQLREALNLVREFGKQTKIHKVGIVVLDEGYGNFKKKRETLPASAQLIESYDENFLREEGLPTDPKVYQGSGIRTPEDPYGLTAIRHGLEMAQAAHAITGGSNAGPMFYLLNAKGPFNFQAAVRYAARLYHAGKVQIVLNSNSWRFGGIGNGSGPISSLVKAFLKQCPRIFWINSAGNDGGMVWNGYAKRKGDSPYLDIDLSFDNYVLNNGLTVTLMWDPESDNPLSGTDIDYDLDVTDSAGVLLSDSGSLRQVKANSVDDLLNKAEGSSNVAMETVTLSNMEIEDGYRIRIRPVSANCKTSDVLRVLIRSTRPTYLNPETRRQENSIAFHQASGAMETFSPNDVAGTITTGILGGYSSVGPTLDGLLKPEVLMPFGEALFNDYEPRQGSSLAAAFLAGVIALLKAENKDFLPEHLPAFLESTPGPVSLKYALSNLKLKSWLIERVLSLSQEANSNVHVYLYPGRHVVVELPRSPAEYPELFSQLAQGRTETGKNVAYFAGALPNGKDGWDPAAGKWLPQVSFHTAIARVTGTGPVKGMEKATAFVELRKHSDTVSPQEEEFRKGEPRDNVPRQWFQMPSREKFNKVVKESKAATNG